MAYTHQDFALYDGNGLTVVFDVEGDVSTASASWKASEVTSGTPTTVTKTPTVGSYDTGAGTTPVTLAIGASDFNARTGTYNHELVLTITSVPTTVAVGKLWVHASLIT